MTGSAVRAPAADCHVHVFDPARFPYRDDAVYRPQPHETATLDQLLAVLDAHGLTHALLVTPTAGYGSDNSAIAAALACQPDRLKGIAVVDADAREADIVSLKAAGFVGVRFDFTTRGADFLTGAGRRLVDILRREQMVLDIQTKADALDAAALAMLRDAAGPVVIDHMALPDPPTGPEAAGFAAILGLADCPHVAIKLSGPFRFSQAGFPYADADPFARAIVAAFGPERCVWGSDWPFVRMAQRIDYGPCLSALRRWLPNPSAQRQVLWDTPKRLFGFAVPP